MHSHIYMQKQGMTLGLPWSIPLLTLMLIAQAVFHFEHRQQTNTQTHYSWHRWWCLLELCITALKCICIMYKMRFSLQHWSNFVATTLTTTARQLLRVHAYSFTIHNSVWAKKEYSHYKKLYILHVIPVIKPRSQHKQIQQTVLIHIIMFSATKDIPIKDDTVAESWANN